MHFSRFTILSDDIVQKSLHDGTLFSVKETAFVCEASLVVGQIQRNSNGQFSR